MVVRVQLMKVLTSRPVFTETTLLNPSAAINHPPAKHQQWQGERKIPPERQKVSGPGQCGDPRAPQRLE